MWNPSQNTRGDISTMFVLIGTGALLSVLGLAVLFLLLNLLQPRRDMKLTRWSMASGLFGVFVGGAAVWGGGQMVGLEMSISIRDDQLAVPATEGPVEDGGPPEGAGGGMMGGGGGGGMMGGGGGGMTGRGGGRAASSKRSLATLVRKLELMTGKISVELNKEQVKSIGSTLVEVGGQKTLSEEQAKATLESLETLLTETQKARLGKVSLPRVRSGSRGGFGAGGGGDGQSEDENPFEEAVNAKALVGLLQRHGVEPPAIEVAEDASSGVEETATANASESLIKRYDKDGDGSLSKEEAPAFFRKNFDRIDVNKDGKCDLKEMQSARPPTPRS
ncbi:MAG: EF-hand domain-containing protein [Planctomycetaceae bacterium]|nr:EF-hand domain-containing protein [Planctomycetaceae bacterium]